MSDLIHVRDEHARGCFSRIDAAEVSQRGEEAIDADRCADGRNRFAEEAHDQVVVTSAAEDRAELRRVEQDGFEDRAGVVGEAAGDGEIERDAIVAVAEGVEMIRDPLDDVDLCRGVIEAGEEIAELRHDIAARIGFDIEEALDAIDLIGGQADAADRVARLVLVAVHQLARDFVEADFVEFVEDAERRRRLEPGLIEEKSRSRLSTARLEKRTR